jgi:hypothetical protein
LELVGDGDGVCFDPNISVSDGSNGVDDTVTFSLNNNKIGKSIYFANVNILTNKMDELKMFVMENKPMIIALSEVIPKNYRFRPLPIEFKLEGYHLYSNIDQNQVRGLCVYVHESVSHSQILLDIGLDLVFSEFILIRFHLGVLQESFLLAFIYRSPNSSLGNSQKLNLLFHHLAGFNTKYKLFLGDFNFPEIKWEQNGRVSTSVNHPAYKFFVTHQDCFLHQLVTFPTRKTIDGEGNCLDLLFTNVEEVVEDIFSVAPLGKSDHSGVVFYIASELFYTKQVETFEKKLYFKADYANMLLNTPGFEDWENLFQGMNCVEQGWQKEWVFLKSPVVVGFIKKPTKRRVFF